jgi:hypothetical protein
VPRHLSHRHGRRGIDRLPVAVVDSADEVLDAPDALAIHRGAHTPVGSG